MDYNDLSDEAINGLLKEREEARKEKDFARADEIYNGLINETRIKIIDSEEGTNWCKGKNTVWQLAE